MTWFCDSQHRYNYYSKHTVLEIDLRRVLFTKLLCRLCRLIEVLKAFGWTTSIKLGYLTRDSPPSRIRMEERKKCYVLDRVSCSMRCTSMYPEKVIPKPGFLLPGCRRCGWTIYCIALQCHGNPLKNYYSANYLRRHSPKRNSRPNDNLQMFNSEEWKSSTSCKVRYTFLCTVYRVFLKNKRPSSEVCTFVPLAGNTFRTTFNPSMNISIMSRERAERATT